MDPHDRASFQSFAFCFSFVHTILLSCLFRGVAHIPNHRIQNVQTEAQESYNVYNTMYNVLNRVAQRSESHYCVQSHLLFWIQRIIRELGQFQNLLGINRACALGFPSKKEARRAKKTDFFGWACCVIFHSNKTNSHFCADLRDFETKTVFLNNETIVHPLLFFIMLKCDNGGLFTI